MKIEEIENITEQIKNLTNEITKLKQEKAEYEAMEKVLSKASEYYENANTYILEAEENLEIGYKGHGAQHIYAHIDAASSLIDNKVSYFSKLIEASEEEREKIEKKIEEKETQRDGLRRKLLLAIFGGND